MRLLLAEDEGELSNALSVILRHNHYSVDVWTTAPMRWTMRWPVNMTA